MIATRSAHSHPLPRRPPAPPQPLHGLRGGLRLPADTVGGEDLGDLVPDRENRVKRRHRLLEDHGDPPPPRGAEGAGQTRRRENTSARADTLRGGGAEIWRPRDGAPPAGTPSAEV